MLPREIVMRQQCEKRCNRFGASQHDQWKEDRMLPADYVFWPVVAAMAASNLYFSQRVAGDRMAMQWDANGKPIRTAPKAVGLWSMVAFALAVRLLVWMLATYVPEKAHGAETAVLLFSLIVAASHVIMARAAMRAGSGRMG
jgi:hypothetical protein